MVMEENESCGSTGCGVADSSVPANTRHHAKKVEVYNEVLRRLKDLNNHDAQLPGFDDQLWAHFNRLPTRYLYISLSLFTIFLTAFTHIHTHS